MFQDINKSELKFSTFVIIPSVFLVPSGHSGDGGDSEVPQHDEYVVRAAPRLSEPAAHVTTLRPAHTQPAPRLVTLQVRIIIRNPERDFRGSFYSPQLSGFAEPRG